MRKILRILAVSLLLCACAGKEPGPGPTPGKKTYLDPVSADPMTWVALTPTGQWIGEEYGPLKSDKTVGIFYFLWHGCHGYDRFEAHNEVHYPTNTDIRSPYNNEEIYAKDPAHPKTLPFGPFSAFHHWGEPYLGYYLSNDKWVFRKHAQMLSDAGVDAIFVDATNGYDYIDNFKVLAKEWEDLRKLGCNTPQCGYLMNVNTNNVFTRLYSQIYGQNLYQDLWFKWYNKPLVLALADNVTHPRRGDFIFRMSWFTYNIPAMDTWWESVKGEGRLPWGGWYPQKLGYFRGEVESASVMAATHPLDNMGRSFDPISWTEPSVPTPEKGIHFYKQLEYALAQNPKFLFLTGWNEWVAQRQAPSPDYRMLGMTSEEFGCAFVDHFNHEFSRDLEPVRGGFGDTYYYYLVDAVRRFKGSKKIPAYKEVSSGITLDGYATDWQNVQASFGDDRGDATEHEHIGWGRIGMLHNHARNDIELCKVAVDGQNIYFYAQAADKLTPAGDGDWMKLFIGVNPKNDPNWEGFDFAVQRKSSAGDEVSLEKSEGGYKWKTVGSVRRAVGERIVEICIPLSMLGISDSDKFTVDFKWIDDTASDGDIQTCLSDGDCAPNGRFRYRYKHEK